MSIELSGLLESDGRSGQYSWEPLFSTVSVSGESFPVTAKGPVDITVVNTGAKVLELTLEGTFTAVIPCARCLEPVEVDIPLKLDREADLKRMFATMRRVGSEDINNVRRYEYNKRMSDYFTDSELKAAFDSAASEEFDSFEQKVGRITQMDNANWTAIKELRDKGLFRIGAVVMAEPSLSGRASQCIKKYQNVLDYKWESTFKNGSVNGSKDQVKGYRYECDAISNWLRTVR